MYTLFAILIVITCILLVLIIMVQNPKGGGLSSAFGGGNQIMGARKTSDFLEKTTWTLAIILVSLALVSNIINTGSKTDKNELLIDDVRDTEPSINENNFDINIEEKLNDTEDIN
ncbi:MAG: preprotein translocase subunit SecG [Flavobacteriales bacterium]|jgi:preprotein translocase subunit SecG|nr:preprotein translocase subunit SecG [Flavobacteriales bacterium]